MDLFDEAIRFAVEKHRGTMRKRENTPYILHPMEVAAIAATMTPDPEVLAAAMLHDTVEDTGASLEEIEERFGPRVAALVAAETEDKRPDEDPAETWRIRKEESLAVLKNTTDPGARMLWLGDKLSNMRAFHRAWLADGDAIWESFNQKDPAQQAWYYRSAEELLSELSEHAAWKELHFLIGIVFKGVN